MTHIYHSPTLQIFFQVVINLHIVTNLMVDFRKVFYLPKYFIINTVTSSRNDLIKVHDRVRALEQLTT